MVEVFDWHLVELLALHNTLLLTNETNTFLIQSLYNIKKEVKQLSILHYLNILNTHKNKYPGCICGLALHTLQNFKTNGHSYKNYKFDARSVQGYPLVSWLLYNFVDIHQNGLLQQSRVMFFSTLSKNKFGNDNDNPNCSLLLIIRF